MKSEQVCRPGSRPRMLVCFLCGREYGTRSLPIHIPQCQKKWLLEEESKPKSERRPLPAQPNADIAIRGGSARAFESFNAEAFAAFEQTLQQCPHCQRRFLPKPFLHHQKGCTAANPAKPAGTGLIPISLTNRLVPGAIAGSMHGKARGQHVPLRLCKPSEESNSKLKMSRSASARPAIWSDADDSFSMDDRDSGQTSSWNVFWNEPQTRNRLPKSRPASHHGNGGYSGGEQSHLVDTFGDLWRTHSREDGLPLGRHKSGAQEWCNSNPRPKSAFTSQQSRPSSSALRSSQGRRKLDLVALAKTLPSGQAGHSEIYNKPWHGKTGGDPTPMAPSLSPSISLCFCTDESSEICL